MRRLERLSEVLRRGNTHAASLASVASGAGGRRLTFVVVAPTRDASVQPYATGVSKAGGYFRELFILGQRKPGLATTLCILEKRSVDSLQALKIVTPTEGRTISP